MGVAPKNLVNGTPKHISRISRHQQRACACGMKLASVTTPASSIIRSDAYTSDHWKRIRGKTDTNLKRNQRRENHASIFSQHPDIRLSALSNNYAQPIKSATCMLLSKQKLVSKLTAPCINSSPIHFRAEEPSSPRSLSPPTTCLHRCNVTLSRGFWHETPCLPVDGCGSRRWRRESPSLHPHGIEGTSEQWI